MLIIHQSIERDPVTGLPTGNLTDGISIVYPNPQSGLSVLEVARKDVPAGVPYLLVDASVVPEDRTFRDAWEADFSAPDGVGIGAPAWFLEKYTEEQAILTYNRENAPAGNTVDFDAWQADLDARVAVMQKELGQ